MFTFVYVKSTLILTQIHFLCVLFQTFRGKGVKVATDLLFLQKFELLCGRYQKDQTNIAHLRTFVKQKSCGKKSYFCGRNTILPYSLQYYTARILSKLCLCTTILRIECPKTHSTRSNVVSPHLSLIGPFTENFAARINDCF